MIEKGAKVKIIFRNSTQMEGIVDEWTDKKSILSSIDNPNDKFIIFHPEEDILGIKIYSNTKLEESSDDNLTDLEKKFEEEYNKPSDDDLRIHNLAKLRAMMGEQEKKIIAGKLKEHSISRVQFPNYQLPSFIKKS